MSDGSDYGEKIQCKKCGEEHHRKYRCQDPIAIEARANRTPTYEQLTADNARLRKAIEEHKMITRELCVTEDFDNELYAALEVK